MALSARSGCIGVGLSVQGSPFFVLQHPSSPVVHAAAREASTMIRPTPVSLRGHDYDNVPRLDWRLDDRRIGTRLLHGWGLGGLVRLFRFSGRRRSSWKWQKNSNLREL
jgi:hypothetical protein